MSEEKITWADLERQFRSISEIPGSLRADGTRVVKRGIGWTWKLLGSADESKVSQFRTIAHLAGFLLNGESGDLLSTWLEQLREQSPCFKVKTFDVDQNRDGTEGIHRLSGTIVGVCEASADECCLLEQRETQKTLGGIDKPSWKLDYHLHAFTSRLAEECFHAISLNPEVRIRLLGDAAAKGFDYWAASRLEAVTDETEVSQFRGELQFWKWSVIAPIIDGGMSELEEESIRMRLEARIRFWVARAINITRGTPLEDEAEEKVETNRSVLDIEESLRNALTPESSQLSSGIESSKASDAKATERSDGVRLSKRWEDIEIIFLSDERVEITRCGSRQTRNYAELGFNDRRTGNPNRLWGVLKAFAQANGLLPSAALKNPKWAATERLILRTKASLKSYFKIAEDPFVYERKDGYRVRFKIGCYSSFDS